MKDMEGKPIPEDIKVFVFNFIASVQQLEVLLLVCSSPGRAWKAEEVAERLNVSVMAATNRLINLSLKGLIKVNDDGKNRTYMCLPGKHTAMITKVSDVYETHRFELIELIGSRTDIQIRNFSDAFRWNQGEKDE